MSGHFPLRRPLSQHSPCTWRQQFTFPGCSAGCEARNREGLTPATGTGETRLRPGEGPVGFPRSSRNGSPAPPSLRVRPRAGRGVGGRGRRERPLHGPGRAGGLGTRSPGPEARGVRRRGARGQPDGSRSRRAGQGVAAGSAEPSALTSRGHTLRGAARPTAPTYRRRRGDPGRTSAPPPLLQHGRPLSAGSALRFRFRDLARPGDP